METGLYAVYNIMRVYYSKMELTCLVSFCLRVFNDKLANAEVSQDGELGEY